MDRRQSANKTRDRLATCVTIGFFVTLVFLFSPWARDESLRDARLILVGALTAGFGTVLNYFFGSTTSSERKNELLAHSTPMPSNPTVVTTSGAVTVESEQAPEGETEEQRAIRLADKS
jgi:hypothetical protein